MAKASREGAMKLGSKENYEKVSKGRSLLTGLFIEHRMYCLESVFKIVQNRVASGPTKGLCLPQLQKQQNHCNASIVAFSVQMC